MALMQGFDDPTRMSGTVEEIGIAKGDVLHAGGNLLVDIGEHDVDGDDAKLTVVDGNDRAMPAPVLAAACRIRGADYPSRTVRHVQRA